MKKFFVLFLFFLSFLKAEVPRLDDYIKFVRVVNIIERYYIEEMTTNQIVEKLLKGGVSAFDAHSSFLDKKGLKNLKVTTNGEFGGLGIVVGMRKGVLTIISPIDDTPAYRAGVKANDVILKINNKATIDMTLDEAVNLMRGKPGTKITLTLIRDGKPVVVHITREIIKIKSVKAYDLKNYPDIKYIRISSFDKNVVTSLKRILANLKNKKGIIIDLRNNPGGLLVQALGTLDLFINSGVLLSEKGRIINHNKVWYAHGIGTYSKIPIVILVNRGSASASEIVSGAMQDRKRAIIVGEKTFGKGSVQAIIPINEDKTEAIRLTIAKYYLPSGRTIQAVGVTPDIKVVPAKVIPIKNNDINIKESELKAHLKAELQKIDKKKVIKKVKKERYKEVKDDNQLQTAINVLRGLIISNQK